MQVVRLPSYALIPDRLINSFFNKIGWLSVFKGSLIEGYLSVDSETHKFSLLAYLVEVEFAFLSKAHLDEAIVSV